MSFILDARIDSSCFELVDWPLCRVLLKNNADYPWIILVPRQDSIQEIIELSTYMQHQLLDEIARLSLIMKTFFNPDKLNIGTLGNIVSQLHIHVVARFTHDPLWPHGVWQEDLSHNPYSPNQLKSLLKELRLAVESVN